MIDTFRDITVQGACEHNLQNVDVTLERRAITLITGVSGSGKSSLAFDTILAEAQRRFFYTLSHYSRQFLDMGSRPKVRRLTGLSPAIALAQNETQPSLRASVATLTDIGELMGIVFARFGDRYCPKHDLPTSRLSIEDVVGHIAASFADRQLAVCVPVVENKKGTYKKQMAQFAAKGFTRAYVDGKVVSLTPTPVLAREEKHTIKVIIDVLKVKPERLSRLQRSLQTALEEGDGYGAYYVAESPQSLDLSSGGTFGGDGGCAQCGYTWPDLDTRHFSANSLGACPTCRGIGYTGADEEEDSGDDEQNICSTCEGTGLDPLYAGIRIGPHSIQDIHRSPISVVQEIVTGWRKETLIQNPAFQRVAAEMASALTRIGEVGLGYLSLSRRIRSLSGGESQRLKLAGILSENLRGVLYVLDEPSQGLHPVELERLWDVLHHLKRLGNTLIIVDHDDYLMRKADWVLDLGPGGGARGGHVMAKFRPSEAADYADRSPTARALTQKTETPPLSSQHDLSTGITLKHLRLNNLTIDAVTFPQKALTVVTGVSGAGKSSLVMGVLAQNVKRFLQDKNAKKKSKGFTPVYCKQVDHLDSFETLTEVDRKPLGKSHVSMPATYLGLYKDIRDLYGQLPQAQIAGFTARDFSVTADGGRCPECKGRGEINLSMRFLPDARVVCPVCEGKRFRPPVLEVRYKDHSIADVLGLTLEEVAELFQHHKRILRRLQPALALGLGYLKLGQPSATLSGGEAQRLKLAPLLSKADNTGHLLLLDEPTTGLHHADVTRLMGILRDLVTSGATIVVIEHHRDVILSADRVIDLGPGASDQGGKVVYSGSVADFKTCRESLTARYL